MSARWDAKIDRLLTSKANWKGVTYTKIYKYLGILFGPDVDQVKQYEAVFGKVEARFARYARTLATLTPVRRIAVYNIFIHPLFSYVSEFYPVAYDGKYSYLEALKLVRKYIIPFRNGLNFKYTHIIAPASSISPAKGLIDLWCSYCMVRMVEQGDLKKWEGCTESQVPIPSTEKVSQRISDQIEASTVQFVHYAMDDAGMRRVGSVGRRPQ